MNCLVYQLNSTINKDETSSLLEEVLPRLLPKQDLITCAPARTVTLTHAKHGIDFTLKRQIPLLRESSRSPERAAAAVHNAEALEGALSQLGLSSAVLSRPRRLPGQETSPGAQANFTAQVCAEQGKQQINYEGLFFDAFRLGNCEV